ncbi:MAG: ATP-binding cassette domain-containing protein [Bacteroidia bacterium]|nr:ATP-binding cassette domain-containing protein [Bacteroidia bacterium]
MIEIKNIYKSFAGNLVLNDISATFERGKINQIIGRSGSGKTVLLKAIVGLHDINKGEIIYDNIVFTSLNFKEKKEIRKQIGMVFQGGALFTSATIEENIIYPLNMFTKMTLKEKKERVNFCLERVNILNANQLYPTEISGGMQKRVAIARAIVLNPKYLFFDEPNSGLDPKTAILIDQLIKEITDEYKTITIINTHDMNSIMEIGDNIVFIHEGKKWWQGSKHEIFNTENKELNDFVFASHLFQRVRNGTNGSHR